MLHAASSVSFVSINQLFICATAAQQEQQLQQLIYSFISVTRHTLRHRFRVGVTGLVTRQGAAGMKRRARVIEVTRPQTSHTFDCSCLRNCTAVERARALQHERQRQWNMRRMSHHLRANTWGFKQTQHTARHVTHSTSRTAWAASLSKIFD